MEPIREEVSSDTLPAMSTTHGSRRYLPRVILCRLGSDRSVLLVSLRRVDRVRDLSVKASRRLTLNLTWASNTQFRRSRPWTHVSSSTERHHP